MNRPVPVSVVIPAYNEARGIPRCLASLAAQRCSIPFEVIVVDNASTDGTAAVARRYRAELPLRVLSQPVKGRGSARRTGFAAARGRIILSTDADCFIPPDWIERMWRVFESEPDTDAVVGSALALGWSPRKAAIGRRLYDIYIYGYRALFGFVPMVGFNFGIRRTTYEISGGFDPTLNAAEDIDLSRKVRRVGRIVYRRIPVAADTRRYETTPFRSIAVYIRNEILCRTRLKARSHLPDIR